MTEDFGGEYDVAMGELMLLLVPRRPRLSRALLERISAIAADTAQVALASVVVPTLFDKGDTTLIVLGGLGTVVFWFVSLLIAQRIK